MMIDEIEEGKHSCEFDYNGRMLRGELTIDGRQTGLILTGKGQFNISDECLYGETLMHDKISLLHCIVNYNGRFGAPDEDAHQANVFPHYVVIGDRHLSNSEEVVKSSIIVLDDAETLFSDFDVFGDIRISKESLDKLVKDQNLGRDIEIGDHPRLAYYTGKREIFSADTSFGTISAIHMPTHTYGGTSGVKMENTIALVIDYDSPVSFDFSTSSIYNLVSYMSLIVGRPQNVNNIRLLLENGSEFPDSVQVYITMAEKFTRGEEEIGSHSFDNLIDAAQNSSQFSTALSSWLAKHEDRAESRHLFFSSFNKMNSYSIDRIVSSANMFDILPEDAAPQKIELCAGLKAAKVLAKKAFKALPVSIDRDSILGALGRLGTSSLKHKVRYRADIFGDCVDERLPELHLVIDAAVDCRNFYVHGTMSKINYKDNKWLLLFLTETLEFVYAASELTEAGWDIGQWINQSSTLTHPFGSYKVNYKLNLGRLKKLLN